MSVDIAWSNVARQRSLWCSAALRPRHVRCIAPAALSLRRSASLAARSSRAACKELDGVGLFLSDESPGVDGVLVDFFPERLTLRGRRPEPVKLNMTSKGLDAVGRLR
jgi:hypothetical protein